MASLNSSLFCSQLCPPAEPEAGIASAPLEEPVIRAAASTPGRGLGSTHFPIRSQLPAPMAAALWMACSPPQPSLPESDPNMRSRRCLWPADGLGHSCRLQTGSVPTAEALRALGREALSSRTKAEPNGVTQAKRVLVP